MNFLCGNCDAILDASTHGGDIRATAKMCWCQRARKHDSASAARDLAVEAATRVKDESPALTASGTWRLYWNRHGAAPNVWCVAPNANLADDERSRWELAVASLTLEARAFTVYRPKATPDEDDGQSSGWLEVTGRLTVTRDGHATIGKEP